MLDVMSWINKLHSSQLKIKEAIQFKMSLKINSVCVEKSKFGETVPISPPLFGIQVKTYLKCKWENTQLDNYHA